MRNNINISGNNQSFTYVLDYTQSNVYTDADDINWYSNADTIYLFEGNTKYYRKKNEWLNAKQLNLLHDNIPNIVRYANIKVYLPLHSISKYVKNVKYALSLNTWINGIKIDLGSFIFKHNDAIANEYGPIKNGNNEYHEYVEFNIINPFDIVYGDDWLDFRYNVCKEPLNINNTGSLLNATLYVITESEDKYIIKDDCIGGMTAFNISTNTDMLSLALEQSMDPLGFKCSVYTNSIYDWLLTYLSETYNINTSQNNILFELVIKSKDSIIPGPTIKYNAVETFGKIEQLIPWSFIKANKHKPEFKLFYDFLNCWDNFEEGWNIVASLIIHTDTEENITVISNELPITQETFKSFVNGGSTKIIDLSEMEIKTYNVINKIENKIVNIERPNDSKSNIIQPVFFKVKDVETLTLHPEVTENICINLDDYKSKVDKFTIQIAGCKFEQIGANQYGVIFKIPGNKLPIDTNAGTYYILNENLELVTTGKFSCVR